jgi:hypothetical protein
MPAPYAERKIDLQFSLGAGSGATQVKLTGLRVRR